MSKPGRRKVTSTNYKNESELIAGCPLAAAMKMLGGRWKPMLLWYVHHEIEFGVPPHAFLLHLRIAHGRTLLGRGMGVAEVSAACGFFDQSHFARHFRRLVGVAPGVYARRVTNQSGPFVQARPALRG